MRAVMLNRLPPLPSPKEVVILPTDTPETIAAVKKKREEEAAKQAEQRKGLIGSGDRSQRIRTYNFPQNRLTDHRINLTLYKLDQVIAGDLTPVTDALVEYDRDQLRGDMID